MTRRTFAQNHSFRGADAPRTLFCCLIFGFWSLFGIWSLEFGLFAAVPSAAKPNIVFILADDLGWGDLSCYGGRVATPQLDAMAREGTRFAQFYVAAPICSPSRAALITGQFPGRWRITSYLQTRQGNRDCGQADYLSTNAPSLPRVLKAAGYATAHIGKWHLGGGRDVTNAPKFAAYGYDLGYGTYESPEPHPDITATNWIWSSHDKVKRWERTRWMVDQTLDFLRAHTNQPCFVNLWLDDVHTPWIPSKEVQDDQAQRGDTRKNLRPVLIETDRQIGRLLTSLREAGSNTLVLFLGDNGPLPPFNQERTAGLRGSKLSLYEGGIREPLIVRWPGVTKAGSISDTPIISTDYYPTILQIAGLPLRPEQHRDGISLVRLLNGEKLADRTFYWHYPHYGNQGGSPAGAVRRGNYKLIEWYEDMRVELYDLKDDPGEHHDLSTRKADQTEILRIALHAWRDQVRAVMPTPNSNYKPD